jgi:flavin reductase (DIM6/NTAB) family NADH-FMN oxidoreductase RutF
VEVVETVIDPKNFREVLGQYPTGVCVIAAMLPTGPIGMVVGSFTSVSLDPPLVAFFPDRQSGTWAALSQAPQFCVSILSAEQEPECRKLASRDPGKFSGLGRQVSPNGSPIVEGAVAWIDCDRHSVTEAGDHFIVLGRVSRLEIGGGGLPLLFFQGGYGRFAPASLVTSDTEGLLTEQLRIVDLARSEIEGLAAHVGGQCVATTRVGDQLIVAASAGQSYDGTQGVPVGQRLPFAPPFGAIFAAWDRDDHIGRWIGSQVDGAQSEVYRAALATVRVRGFAVGSCLAPRRGAPDLCRSTGRLAGDVSVAPACSRENPPQSRIRPFRHLSGDRRNHKNGLGADLRWQWPGRSCPHHSRFSHIPRRRKDA